MNNLFKPEYLWRPQQILRRLSFKPSSEITPLSLPWNCTIEACSGEDIGRSIATQGIYDLPVTEAIYRLAEPGETLLDAGANIGYMTLVLARSAGPAGRVRCFEPNPFILPTLRNNVKNWQALPIAAIEVSAMGLSDRAGESSLSFPEGYGANWGTAKIDGPSGTIPVQLNRLDEIQSGSVGVMKVDVEGHEAAVFKGAEKLLKRRLIRDVLFEEHEPYPALSHQTLMQHGYKIFRLTRSTFRPLLLSADEPARQRYLPSNFLATADPARALAKFSRRGWVSLSSSWNRPI